MFHTIPVTIRFKRHLPRAARERSGPFTAIRPPMRSMIALGCAFIAPSSRSSLCRDAAPAANAAFGRRRTLVQSPSSASGGTRPRVDGVLLAAGWCCCSTPRRLQRSPPISTIRHTGRLLAPMPVSSRRFPPVCRSSDSFWRGTPKRGRRSSYSRLLSLNSIKAAIDTLIALSVSAVRHVRHPGSAQRPLLVFSCRRYRLTDSTKSTGEPRSCRRSRRDACGRQCRGSACRRAGDAENDAQRPLCPRAGVGASPAAIGAMLTCDGPAAVIAARFRGAIVGPRGAGPKGSAKRCCNRITAAW